MTREELLDKAVYIQYPLDYATYKQYNVDKEIHKLPLPEKGMMYDGWYKNEHHFTTEYHRIYSIPLYCKLFNLKYNENDFVLEERKSGNYDLSFLKPKKDYKYEIYGYTRGEHFDNISFDDITYNNSIKKDITDYHRLYKYGHECSRLINKTIDNERKLFVNGDSQMIPDIPFLSSFFKEVWYFDNREKNNLQKKYKDAIFSDVLIALNCGSNNDYLIKNFS